MTKDLIEDSIDIDGDCPVSVCLETFERHGLTITDFVANGPAGGNPMFTLLGTPQSHDNLRKELGM